jgi:ionotropic glutamate receptor NMDA 2B
MYLEKINQLLLQYQQKGDLERLQTFWLTGSCSPETNTQTHSSSEPLGVRNFISAFLLLWGGVVIAFLALALEYLYCWKLRKWLQRVDRNGWCGLISTVKAIFRLKWTKL